MSALTFNTTADTITLGSRSLAFANIGRLMKIYKFTDSTDITPGTCASGGTAISASQTIVLPTAGIIKVGLYQCNISMTTSSGASIGFGLVVNGTTYFNQSQNNSVICYGPGAAYYSTGVGTHLMKGVTSGGMLSTAGYQPGYWTDFDIAVDGMATGSQTVSLKVGKSANLVAGYTDAFTIKGTTNTTIFHVYVYDLS